MRLMVRAAMVAAFLALTVACVVAQPARAATCRDAEKDMLRLVNHARVDRGLSPLRVHQMLRSAALSHARDMMARDYFSHWRPDGADCGARSTEAGYRRSGYRSWTVSEVIAWGSGALGTPPVVFKAWMRSTPHRRILLGKRWRDIGVGCAFGTFRGMTGSTVWTIDVGVRAR
jgi:uncharacterized protein YkwD